MKRLILSAAAAAALCLGLGGPAVAQAQPANVAQGNQIVAAWAFNNSWWVHSSSAGNWYETTNGNMGVINPTGSGTWQLIKDAGNGKCLAFIQSGSQADEVVDQTCNSSNPAQSWQSASVNQYITTWYFWNRYEISHDSCSGGHKAFITGTAAIGTLYVECPSSSNGSPNNDQQFVLTPH